MSFVPGRTFLNELKQPTLHALAVELNRQEKWKDLLAACCDTTQFQLSDGERSLMSYQVGPSLLDTPGYQVMLELGNLGMTVNHFVQYLYRLRMEPALRLLIEPVQLEILEQPIAEVAVLEGQMIKLTCSATGFPFPKYRWFHVGADGRQANHECKSSSLLIKEASLQDSGMYLCQVYNTIGDHVNSSVSNVQVDNNKHWHKGRASEHVEAQQPSPVRQPIIQPPSNTANVQGQHRLNGPHDRSPGQHRLNGPHERPPDMDAGPGLKGPGIINNTPGFPRRQSIHTTPAGPQRLARSEMYDITIPPPFIREHPKSVQVMRGSSLKLICRAESTTPMFFTWRRNNQDLRQLGTALLKGVNSPELVFQECMEYHCGTYTCVVTNSSGISVESNEATLRVYAERYQDQPTFVKNLPRKLLEEEGKTLKLSVDVRCGETLSYKWMRNNVEIRGENGPNLEFEVKALDNKKTFQCIVTTCSGKSVLSLPTRLEVLPRSVYSAVDKVALLLGNSEYLGSELMSLPCVPNDLRLMETKLKALDFKVCTYLNLKADEMQTAIKEFCSLLVQGVYGVFMFSGHGFEVAENQSYMVSTDAENMSMDRCVCINTVIEAMQLCDPALILILLDICRENPASMSQMAFPPCRLPTVRGNTVRFYATSYGKEAYEKKNADHSVFITCLSQVLHLPCDIRHVFDSALEELKKDAKSNSMQYPSLQHNLKDPRTLADPINTQGHTRELSQTDMMWRTLNVEPAERLNIRITECGLNFIVDTSRFVTNILVMRITPCHALDRLTVTVNNISPEISMVVKRKDNKQVTYHIEDLQRQERPLEFDLVLDFVYKGVNFDYTQHINLHWPLAAVWGKRSLLTRQHQIRMQREAAKSAEYTLH